MAGADRKVTALRILLLTLLLAVQALGHAHAIDHMVEGDSALCSICSVTGHSDGAVVDSCDTVGIVPQPHTVPLYTRRSIPSAGARLPEARAPPLS